MIWTQQEAILLCREIEQFSPFHGFHVALTGGTLYKHGPRKDLDIIFYHIDLKRTNKMDVQGLFAQLKEIGFSNINPHPFHCKATYRCKPVDIMFPQIENLQPSNS